MSETECYRCDTTIDVQEDEWWAHSWDERPSKDNIEKALEDREFRDWFQTNYVLCPSCHDVVVEVVNDE